MSVLGAIAGIIGFILSPFGVACMLFGLVGFFVVPILCKPFRTKFPAHFYLWLATSPIRRAAIVVSQHNDILFKQMRFDALGVEKITLDGEEKDFEDPDAALHYWKGIPFALADEVHGLLFDPRHAALGARKKAAEKRGEADFEATKKEWKDMGVRRWIRGFYEMPLGDQELVNLSDVRQLVDGGERAEYGNRVESFYEESQAPFQDGTSISKFFYPVIAFMIPFCGIWVLSSQLGTGGANPADSVRYGVLGLLLSSTSVREALGRVRNWLRVRAVWAKCRTVDAWTWVRTHGFWPWLRSLNWRKIAAVTFWLLVIGGFQYLLFAVLGGVLTIAINLCLLVGYLFLPLLSVLFRPSTIMSGIFSKLFFRLGFMGFQEPVFQWTPKEYVIEEFAHLDKVGETTWYGMFGAKVGFSFPPEPDSWDAEVIPHAEMEREQRDDDLPSPDPLTADIRPDGRGIMGGEREPSTNLPPQFVRSETMREGGYGGFLPLAIQDNKYYLHTKRALERFKGSANGEKTHLRLQEAKEEHGGGTDPMDDQSVLYLSSGMGFLGVVLGVFFFIA